jgi:hypothetical protein
MPSETPLKTNKLMDPSFRKALIYLIGVTLAFIGAMVGLDKLNQILKTDIDKQAQQIKTIENARNEELQKSQK